MPISESPKGIDLARPFAAAVEAAQGEIARFDSWAALGRFACSLDLNPVARSGLPLDDIEMPRSVEAIADRPVGVTQAALAVAETGSLLLVEPDPLDRYVSLLTRHLIVAVREEDIVPTLADAFGWLAAQPRAAAYATFVTGPSRTADIERSLTIGVQGPSRLTAAILTERRP